MDKLFIINYLQFALICCILIIYSVRLADKWEHPQGVQNNERILTHFENADRLGDHYLGCSGGLFVYLKYRFLYKIYNEYIMLSNDD